MAEERVGYRRLYRSRGCSIEGEESQEVSHSLGDIDVDVYFGPKPKIGVMVQTGDKYFTPGATATVSKGTIRSDAGGPAEVGVSFTEIRCSLLVELSDDLSTAFHGGDASAHDHLLEVARQRAADLRPTADLVAGIIGLRFHRQLVLEYLDENLYLERSATDRPAQFSTPVIEVLERIELRKAGVEQLTTLLVAVGQAPAEARELAATTLQWLLWAWEERNPVTKFLSLFIPLECVLEGVRGDPVRDQERAQLVRNLAALVTQHGGDRERSLMALVDELRAPKRTGLAERFEQLASDAQLPGWTEDIKAFRRFNRSRNRLLHRGDRRVELGFGVGEDEYLGLEDLTERYVCWALFRDAAVYPSRWRPSRPPQLDPA
jgi:hypothetical protein